MVVVVEAQRGARGQKSWSGRRSSEYRPGKGWGVPQSRRRAAEKKKKTPTTTTTTTTSPAPSSAPPECAACVIPHPMKAAKGGEDSHFIGPRGSRLTVGVADGVSGWAADGVDPALYARELSKHGKDASWLWGDPFEVMDYAHSRSESLGSSTFTVATIEGLSLRYSNVGDSGVKVFRRGSVVEESEVQEHYFNCPKQLANPKKVKECDTPDVADGSDFRLQSGDVVVLATDGVFDNMFPKDIGRIVSKKGRTAEELAQRIAAKASENANDPKYLSPFAKEAWALESKEAPVASGLNNFFSAIGVAKEENPYAGGKLDDITVVVVKIPLL